MICCILLITSSSPVAVFANWDRITNFTYGAALQPGLELSLKVCNKCDDKDKVAVFAGDTELTSTRTWYTRDVSDYYGTSKYTNLLTENLRSDLPTFTTQMHDTSPTSSSTFSSSSSWSSTSSSWSSSPTTSTQTRTTSSAWTPTSSTSWSSISTTTANTISDINYPTVTSRPS